MPSFSERDRSSIKVETVDFFSNPEYRRRTRIVAQAPMRITMGGGGTDVLWYSRLKGGAWISAAIDLSVQTTLSQTEERGLIKINHGREAYMGYDYREIENPIIRECLDVAGVTRGVEISTQADASAGSGLGGSGAMEVSMLLALHTYKGEFVTKARLAEEACQVEIDRLGRPIGPQDQLTAAFGGINYYEIDTSGNVSIESLELEPDTVHFLEQNLLYFRTGIHRDAGSVLEDQKNKMDESWPSRDVLVSSLDRIKDLGQRARGHLLEGRVDEFGATLDEHWRIKRQLSGRVSNTQIDDWYEAGMRVGALGGKIMGAGGGGWFVFYVNRDQRSFAQKMTGLGLIEKSIRFDWDGAKVLVNQSY